ncbi:hypothetical protein Pfo_014793 [Paulownia fortunei]|nr:hypothetical protein Pfo_014793 [Paulownia fortunei]
MVACSIYRLLNLDSCISDFFMILEQEDCEEITANSLHPGVITTNLFGHLGIFEGNSWASTTCYVALHPQVKGISGEYFSDNNLATASTEAADIDLARKMRDLSMNLIK